ncbi:MAG: hypothetical protein AB7V42_06565 [Thermoleophilia bacterium]
MIVAHIGAGRAGARIALVLAALGCALLALAGARPAGAIPPGGPVENRNGASVAIDQRVVAPVADGGGQIAFSGTGFAPDQVLWVKVDDGLVLPDPARRPAPPAGSNHTPDSFLVVKADGTGAIAGTVDLSDTRDEDAGLVGPGVHRLRFLGNSPQAYSIHADVLVAANATLPVAQVGAPPGAAAVGPGAALPVTYLGADHLYDDIPRLVAGSVVPYRVAGFAPDSTVSVKLNDGAIAPPGVANGVWATFTTDGAGAASGLLPAIPTGTPGSYWLRFLQPGRSVYAPFAVVANDGGRDVSVGTTPVAPGAVVPFSTANLVRSPADYWPTPATNGQSLSVQLDGAGTPQAYVANDGGSPGTGSVAAGFALPADVAPGAHELVFWTGFTAQSDGPQAVFVRPFTVASAGSGAPTGPAGPQPDPGTKPARARAPRFTVSCRLIRGRTAVRCTVATRRFERPARSPKPVTTARAQVRGVRGAAGARSRKALRLVVRSTRPLPRGVKVTLRVVTAGAARTITVRAR